MKINTNPLQYMWSRATLMVSPTHYYKTERKSFDKIWSRYVFYEVVKEPDTAKSIFQY